MTPERLAQVEGLFHRVLECDPIEQIGILAGADPELRREVEALLSSEKDASRHLRDVVNAEAATATTVDANEPRTGAVFGPYRLLQLLGEGGMGEVWLAEQKQPVRRRVALKLVKAGMSTREVIARFESERQALALMNHPAIAKAFDAGSTPQGTPYFVMEYVAGLPLTIYCDNHRLSTHERLELFNRVCDGVQHAHQKAIIHRDLKPSNILVTEVDGQPAPRIIDFGVAKALGQKLTDQTLFTRVGTLVGTPEYMSPEQALSFGEDIDTRTDVYSLGIILYELLVGEPPLDLHKIAIQEFLRRLREEEPSKPSAKVREQNPVTASEVAGKRQTEPFALAKQMRGDLDAITLKALEKDRSRRYGSPADLAADVARYLKQEPVTAIAASRVYRARKFAHRHRAALLAFAAFLLVLVAAVFVSMWEATQAEQAKRVALEERDRANAEADTERAIDSFLRNDLLGQANPVIQSRVDTTADPNLTVRAALDRAAVQISTAFKDKPIVEAAVQETLGNAYVQLGLFTKGRQHLQRALALRRNALGPDSPPTLDSMSDIAWDLLRFEHKYAEAQSILENVLDKRRRVLGENHFDTLRTMVNLGGLNRLQGKLSRSELLLTEAIKGFERLGDPSAWPALAARNDLALLYERQRRIADAETLFNMVLEEYRRQVGQEHPSFLNTSNNLAVLYREQGMFERAEPLLKEVVRVRRRILGDEHSETQRAVYDLALLYKYESRYKDAEQLMLTVLDVRKRVLGPEDDATLNAMNNLGQIYYAEGSYSKADVVLTEALRIQRRIGRAVIATLLSLASLRLEQHKYLLAEKIARETETALEGKKSNQWVRGACQVLLGASLAGQRKYATAESLLLSGYQDSLQYENANPSAGSRLRLQKYESWIVQLYRAWGKPHPAEEWQRRLDATSVRRDSKIRR